MSDRIDELLALALEGAQLPADVTDAERQELEQLLESRTLMRRAAAGLEEELNAAMPVARARFQRFLDAETRPAPVQPREAAEQGHRLLPWGPAFALPRVALISAPVLVLAAVALVAVVVLNNAFGDVEVALAEGDYFQAEGVVREARPADGGLEVVVETGAGRFSVDVAADARIQRDGVDADSSALMPGTVVVVDGLVGQGRRVKASNVLIGSHTPPLPQPLSRPPDDCGPLEGAIVLFRLAANGDVGEVVLKGPGGGPFVVPVDGVSVEGLLRRFPTALGQRIVLTPIPDTRLFRIDFPASDQGSPSDLEPPSPAAGRPALTIRGVVLEGAREGVLLATRDGRIKVGTGPGTRLLANSSGLGGDELRDRASLVGHVVVVVGHPVGQDGQFVAAVVIVGPKLRQAEH